MAIEDLVDDFWRESLTANLSGPQAQAKWTSFVTDLQARVAPFPKDAQDEILWRAATRNAECIGVAQVSLDALRRKLGLPASNSQLAEVATEAFVSATIGQGVSAFFRLFR
jgi:hypothetical protein